MPDLMHDSLFNLYSDILIPFVLLITATYFTFSAVHQKKAYGFRILLTFVYIMMMILLKYVQQSAFENDMNQNTTYPIVWFICITLSLCEITQIVIWVRYRFLVKAHKQLKQNTFHSNGKWLR